MHEEQKSDLILFGKYRLIRRLGSGGTSEVYLAEHLRLGIGRAIKRISKNQDNYEALLHEAEVLKKLNHSGIPAIYDIEEDESCTYIIEEYLEGESLAEYLVRHGACSFEQAAGLILPVCELLQYLHEQKKPILYLDLKPDNVLICEEEIKLVDFGAAWDRDEVKNRTASFGTEGFAAPEQLRGLDADERSDIFGVGALLQTLLGGRHAVSRLPDREAHIVLKAMREKPAERYHSMRQMIQALSDVREAAVRPAGGKGRRIVIALAASGGGLGLSTAGIYIASLLNRYGIETVMEEYSEKPVYSALRERCGTPVPHENIFRAAASAEVCVREYGILSEANLEEFNSGDLRFLLLGTREWELDAAEKAILLTMDGGQISYLFHLMSLRRFQTVIKDMKGARCIRVPLIDDPWNPEGSEADRIFLKQLLEGVKGGALCRKLLC